MLRRYEIKILAVAGLVDQEATRTLSPRSGLGTDGEVRGSVTATMGRRR